MDSSSQKGEGKKKINEVKTFPLGEKKSLGHFKLKSFYGEVYFLDYNYYFVDESFPLNSS